MKRHGRGTRNRLRISAPTSSLRHSIVSSVPNGSFDSLYPLDSGFVDHGNGLCSPKSLAELATESLCRALPKLEGELPDGLPIDVVDDIVRSLIAHSAINPTTLRTLRHCELSGVLSLAGCRGVTDAWLEPFSKSQSSPVPALAAAYPSDSENSLEDMELDAGPRPSFCVADGCEDSSSSSESFISAHSTASSHMVESHEAFYSPGLSATPTVSPTNNITLLDLRGSNRLTDRGLLQLHSLPFLEVAKLDHCHSIIGPGLRVLSSSQRLHTLSLAHCRRLSDEGMINISHLMALENLSLDGCRCLTDRSLVAISGMTELRKLDLSQCDLITDNGLEQLAHLQNLEEISLAWCRLITNTGLALLCGQLGRSDNLRALRLVRCRITDEGINTLESLTSLEELDLNGCSAITSGALGNVLTRLRSLTTIDVSYCPDILKTSWQGKIQGVKTLDLRYANVEDGHIRKLTNLPMLEELNLDSCKVGDRAIQHIAMYDVMPKLQVLDLADTDVSDAGLEHLAKLQTLTKLSLFYCNISRYGLRHVAKLSNLHTLNLDSRDIDDHGLRYLKGLKNLKHLDVFSGRITDTGCRHISSMLSLESVEICGGGVGDLGCSLLARLENLTSLNLSQNEYITDRGAAALAALYNLRALNLSNTQVTSEALRYFVNLRQLQSLALYGCRNVDNEYDLEQLERAVPSLKCLRRHNSSEEEGTCVAMDETEDDRLYLDGTWDGDDEDDMETNSDPE